MSKQTVMTIILAAAAVGLLFLVAVSTKDTSRASRTALVLSDLRQLHAQSPLVSTNDLMLVDDWAPLPREKRAELAGNLQRHKIDWRDLRLEGGRIFDPWGSPVDVLYQFCGYHVMLQFRSTGADRRAGSPDDIF